MKLKNLAIALVITILFSSALGIGINKIQKEHAKKDYAAILTVYEINDNAITFQDVYGNLWEYETKAAILWTNGTIAAGLFNDNGTPHNVYDDVLVSVSWQGTITNLNQIAG